MEKKEVIVKTLSAKALIVGLILSVCVPLYMLGFNAGVGGMNELLDRHSSWCFVVGFLFIPMVLSAASSKLRFTRGELSFIYSMVVMSFYLTAVTGHTSAYSRLWFGVTEGLKQAAQKPDILRNVPAIMGSQISAGALAGMTAGNHPPGWYPVPWNELATPILYYTVMTVSLWFSLLFAGQILSSVWLRVESLAFPLESALTRLFEWSSGGEGSEVSKPTLFKQKFLWIGFLIGVLSMFFNSLPIYWPPFILPPYGWAGGAEIYGLPQIMRLRVIQFHGGVQFEPWAFGFGLIVPTSVAFTVPLYWIIFMWILFPVMVSIGEFANPLTATPQHDKWWAVWGTTSDSAPSPVVWRYGYGPIILGMAWAATFVPLVWHWRAFYGTVKSKEYRVSWIGYGVCTLIFLGMMLIGNIPIQYALLVMFLMFISYLMHARMFAETGGYLGMMPIGGGISINYEGADEFHNLLLLMGSQGNPAGVYPAVHVGTYYFAQVDFQNGGGQIRNPLQWSISGLKVGDNVKAPRKHIFIAQVIAIAITVILVSVYYPNIVYYWSGGFTFADWRYWPHAYNLSIRPAPAAYGGLWDAGKIHSLYIYAVGIAVGTFIAVSKMKFGGITRFISPISIYLFACAGFHLWFPLLICFIVRLLLTRMMGARAVENTLYPLGIGIVLGFSVMWIPNSIVGILKGYPIGFGLRWWP